MAAFPVFKLTEWKPKEGEHGIACLVGTWAGLRVVVRPDPDQEEGEVNRRWILTARSLEAAENRARKRQRKKARRAAEEEAAGDRP